jgi:two-component system, LuxR family, sensor kinase FixL
MRDACERVIEATQDAVVFIDANATIVRFNAAASKIFGYTAEQALGQPVTLLMPEPYAREHSGYITRYEQTKEPHAIGQIRLVMGRRSDGSRFPLELSVTEVGDESVRYAAILRDISDRARIEQQLAHKNRMASVGLLASMFAHEVGNPLNNMFIHAQMLQRKVARHHLQDTVGDGLGLIMDELRRLTNLLHEFRELYQNTPTLAPVSIVVVLSDVLRTQVIQPGLERIELCEEIEPGLPAVLGNRDKLKQVFINLCKNAIEAMPNGGQLTVRAKLTNGQVIVEVTDTGNGIPADIDPFEAFHTTKPRGSGLGLPVVRQIVLDHGGEVKYVTEPGRGTTFWVELRAAD